MRRLRPRAVRLLTLVGVCDRDDGVCGVSLRHGSQVLEAGTGSPGDVGGGGHDVCVQVGVERVSERRDGSSASASESTKAIVVPLFRRGPIDCSTQQPQSATGLKSPAPQRAGADYQPVNQSSCVCRFWLYAWAAVCSYADSIRARDCAAESVLSPHLPDPASGTHRPLS